MPTEYEKFLMEYLGFKKLNDLVEFLNHPSWGCLDMQVPPNLNEVLGETNQEA